MAKREIVEGVEVWVGDCCDALRQMPPGSAQCCVTSPPYYGLRDYGIAGQVGSEASLDDYVQRIVGIFSEVRRVLRDDGTVWLNVGDSYAVRAQAAGWIKEKDLIGVPWRLAFALQADGWYLRQDIIWHKPNPMPSPVKDRCASSHEYIFLLSKSAKYFFDSEAMREPAVMKPQRRNSRVRYEAPGAGEHRKGTQYLRETIGMDSPDGKRTRHSVWTVSTKSYPGAHFAVFPPDLIAPCVLSGSPIGGVVLDPFGGSGTTAQVALQNGRKAVLCELNPDYIELQRSRIAAVNCQPNLVMA